MKKLKTATPDKTIVVEDIIDTARGPKIRRTIRFIRRYKFPMKLKDLCRDCKYLSKAQLDIEGTHIALCCTESKKGWRELKGKATTNICKYFREKE